MLASNPAIPVQHSINIQVLNESSIMLIIEGYELAMASQKIQQLIHQIMHLSPAWLIDCVGAYNKLLVEFSPSMTNQYDVINFIKRLSFDSTTISHGKIFHIPVCYEALGDYYESDIELVSANTGLATDDIIKRHCQIEYKVYAIGFMPNFAYLGDLHKDLQLPRLSKPRLKVSAGAVAIADNQTAIYPSNSPGGWHILGYTPLTLLHNLDYAFAVGDTLKFESISLSQFNTMRAKLT